MNISTQGHILKRYDEEMLKLQGQVLEMGSLVREQLKRVSDILLQERDAEIGEMELLEGDRPINMMELKADKTITRMLAKRAPVGSDLRFIVAVSRIISDLEHIGDEVAMLAKPTPAGGHQLGSCRGVSASEELRVLIREILEVLDAALHVFRVNDEEGARLLVADNTAADGPILQRLEKLGSCSLEETSEVNHAVNLVLLVRSLERMVNHIRNIAEAVVYLTSGKDIRHKGKGN